MEEYRLGDEVIGQIAKLLQVAILTGTDVVDNLRTVKVQVDEDSNQVVLGDEYRVDADSQIEKLLSFAKDGAQEESENGSAS